MGKQIADYRYDFLDEKEKQYWLGRNYAFGKSDIDPKALKRIVNEADVIKVGRREIVFITFYDWKGQLNPVIKAWYKFKQPADRWNSNYFYAGKRINSKSNPLIIHRKEEFYCEYNYDFSDERRFLKEWTDFYENSGIPEFKVKNKIGRKNYWDEALKKLKAKFPEEFKRFESGYQCTE